MTTWSYSQLEQIWTRNGGSTVMAPLMAAIAMVESAGNDQAENPSGATGLWQLEWPLYENFVPGATSRQAYLNPDINARAAVKLSRNDDSVAPGSPVYANWLQYEPPGAYKQYLVTTSSAPVSSAGTGGGSTGSTSGTSGTAPSGPTASDLSPAGILTGAEGLLHGAATVIDYFFGMFGRGQGWRFIFLLIMAVAVIASYKELSAAGIAPRLVPERGL